MSSSNRQSKNGPLKFHADTETKLLQYVEENAENNPESVIKTIDQFCWNEHWMMHVGDEKGKILSNEVLKKQPHNVLELGTYCAYSTIRIAMNLPKNDGGTVYTIDPNSNLTEQISKKLVEKAGLTDKVVFLKGYSQNVINNLPKTMKFDLVFFDHDKQRYYPDLLLLESLGLLNDGCVLVADNVIVFNINNYYDYVSNSSKYDTTIHKAGLEYADDERYKDGVIVSIKK